MALTKNSVAYWQDIAQGHKEYAATRKRGSAAQRYHENRAMECNRKAAEAAAAHAFPTKKAENVNT